MDADQLVADAEIDDFRGTKAGTAAADVGRQWLGRLDRTANGIVTVTTCVPDGGVLGTS
ncbi:hypothetical protein [Streptomyces sp. NPDC017991]|uniref:hypothetical protein n=1 Tax=Streptomyces sp. NPDC017991 TaxID=3365026 RepID=UPI0037AF65B8